MNFTNDELKILLNFFNNINLNNENKILINEFVSLEKKNINAKTKNGFVPVIGFCVEIYFPNEIGKKYFEFLDLSFAIKEIKKSIIDYEVDYFFNN